MGLSPQIEPAVRRQLDGQVDNAAAQHNHRTVEDIRSSSHLASMSNQTTTESTPGPAAVTETDAGTVSDAGTDAAREPKVLASYNHHSPANVAFRAHRARGVDGTTMQQRGVLTMALRECKDRYTTAARTSNILSLAVEYAVEELLTAKIAELDELLGFKL